jgi:hypothetical protein
MHIEISLSSNNRLKNFYVSLQIHLKVKPIHNVKFWSRVDFIFEFNVYDFYIILYYFLL